ncbi:MAG: Wzz/FepE/Etk N-terminal domain-containing protein [Hyphomonadaceae bacterium]|nr:Wzz/FepE/Etk N-terminal domain-containing protein [Hyphomonadaceae bacterium]
MSVETWNEREKAGATAPRAPARAMRIRPRLGMADLALQLWRAKMLMFLVFLPIALIGIALTLVTPTKYPASTRLLVRLGQEYVFDPIVGDAAKGAFPQQEEMLQAETELARSPVIAERVINHIGLARLYPDLGAEKARAQSGRSYAVDQRALEAFAKDLTVSAAPKSSILRMTYAHTQPQLAADTLNAFVTEYLNYRREVLAGRGVSGLTEQRDVIESRLKAADEALQQYLARNGLSDFDAETAAATRAFSEISDELSKVEASLREAEAKAAGLTRQMQTTPKEVDLYIETTSAADVEKLRLERQDMLTRYRPDSRAVQDLDKRIATLESYIKGSPAAGLRRIGPNPTFQALEADQAVQTANITAMTGRSIELRRQKLQAENKLSELADLEPEYQRLKRDRDALEASAGTFATREQSERARSELATRSADNISIYEPARPPARGDSPKRLIALAAAFFGLFTALVVGLLRVWSIRSFATAGAIERTLGIRVLAEARDRSP